MIRWQPDDPQFQRPVRGGDRSRPRGAERFFLRPGEGGAPQAGSIEQRGGLERPIAPPGNRLEALRGELAGKHSIRINDQWRIIFRWTLSGPEEVEIVDYH
jgi:hypothetical protein